MPPNLAMVLQDPIADVLQKNGKMRENERKKDSFA